MKVLVEYELTSQIVQSLLVDCFEGGYSPWIRGAERVSGNYDPNEKLVWYGQDRYTHAEDGGVANFAFDLSYDREEDAEGEGKGHMTIGPLLIARGFEELSKTAPAVFQRIVTEEGDALDADAFMQCVVFGKIIYG